MQKIILDTNVLMAIGQFNVDIFSEIDRICDFRYSLCIIKSQLEELTGIQKSGQGKDSRAAKLAFDIIKSKNIEAIETEDKKDVDSQILDLAAKNNYIVATQDKELKYRLKNKGIKVIFLRQQKYMDTR